LGTWFYKENNVNFLHAGNQICIQLCRSELQLFSQVPVR
jgi:hypothetical protein